MSDIKIYGKLLNFTDDGILAGADQIKDDKKGKFQSAINEEFTGHTSNKSNPHGVTKAQIGLGNVDNTKDIDKPISTATSRELNEINNKISNIDNTSDLNKPISNATKTALEEKADGLVTAASLTELKDNLDTFSASVSAALNQLNQNKIDKDDNIIGENLQNLTKANIGLGNVDNTRDLDKPISGPQQTALDKKADKTEISSFQETQTIVIRRENLDNLEALGANVPFFTRHYYTVTQMLGGDKEVTVGSMLVFSDNMMHVITQVLFSHFFIENGIITESHNHNKLFIYTRSYNRTESVWSKWTDFETGLLTTGNFTETDKTTRSLFTSAGITFDEHTGYSLNSVTLYEKEASVIYSNWFKGVNCRYAYSGNTDLITNLPFTREPEIDGIDLYKAFSGCTSLSTAFLSSNTVRPSNMSLAFSGCTELDEIKGIILVGQLPIEGRLDMFKGCTNLTTVNIKELNFNLDIKDLAIISKESLKYMLDNAVGSSPIVITVHPTIYTKVENNSASWNDLYTLAQTKQVRFAK